MISLRKRLVEDVHHIALSVERAQEERKQSHNDPSWTDWGSLLISLVALAVSVAALLLSVQQFKESGPVYHATVGERSGITIAVITNVGRTGGSILELKSAGERDLFACNAELSDNGALSLSQGGKVGVSALTLEPGESRPVIIISNDPIANLSGVAASGETISVTIDNRAKQGYDLSQLDGYPEAVAACSRLLGTLTNSPEDLNGNS